MGFTLFDDVIAAAAAGQHERFGAVAALAKTSFHNIGNRRAIYAAA
jgi:hypothetical protein